MIEWSIDACRASGSVRSIVVAVPPGFVHDLGGDDLQVIDGGATRSRSVANALEVVDTELVAIHDAARPLLTAELIEELVARLDADQAAAAVIAAAPVTDTIKRAGGEDEAGASAGLGTPEASDAALDAALVIEATLDRRRLWAAQTPQVFRTEALRAALEAGAATHGAATDEAMLIEAAGGTVLLHPVSAENFKVTTPLDLRVAELLLAARPAAPDSVPE